MDSQSFLLKRVQPALSGLMDGSLSTLAPIFAVVLATHHPLTAFYTGAATALGAGVSMAFSEGLSDTGDLTGRGSPVLRGAITGGGTFAGGIFHTLPFLIPGYGAAISAAIIVVAAELLTLAWLRHKFFQTSFARSFLAVAVGGAIIASLSAALASSRLADTRPSEPTPTCIHTITSIRAQNVRYRPLTRRTIMTTSLPTTRLGWTGMHLTRTGFGAWAIGGGDWAYAWGNQDDAASIAAIRHAVESGINWIDTAAVYGLGHSEEVVAAALAGPARGGPALRLHQGRPGLGSGRPVRGAPPGRRAGQHQDRGRGLAAAAAGRADRPVPDALAGRGRHAAGGVLAGLHRPQARGQDPRGRAVQPRHLASWRRPSRSARWTPSSRRSA